MRKHFLILMLFTLLPLAGWAYDEVKFQIGDTPLNPATIDQTKADDPTDPNSVYLIYNALEKDTPIPAVIGEEEITLWVSNVAWYKTTVSGGQIVKTGSAINKIKNAGTYLCEFQVNQGNHQGAHSGLLTIAKRELEVAASNLINDNALTFGDVFTDANVTPTFTNWPETLTDAQKADLQDEFGTVTYQTSYVPFTTGVTDTTDPESYSEIIPIVTGLNSSNYDFKEKRGKLQVVAKSFANTTLDIIVNNRFYNGLSEGPAVVVTDAANSDVTLVYGTDYELTYFSDAQGTTALAQAPIHVGNYYFKINGLGNYTGTYSAIQTYKVRPERLEFSLKKPTITYDSENHDLTKLDLYTIEGLAAVDKVKNIAVTVKDLNAAGTALEPATNPVKNVAKRGDGYQIAGITVTFTTAEPVSVAQDGDYQVVILTPNFKINKAPISITIKNQQAHEDEVAGWTAGKEVTPENMNTYLTASGLVGTDVFNKFPKIVTTTKVGKDYNLYFEKNAQNVQQWPTIKDAGAQDVSKNYDFNTTTVVSGLLEVIEDPGVLYVRPLADTYGSFQNGKGFIKVEVVGADDDDVNKALENLLNNKKVTPRVFTSENPDFAAYNGKILDVTAFDAAPTAEILAAAKQYPNAGTYYVDYDASVFESATWTELSETYDINLTGRPTYTINKAPLTITLNDQSLNTGDDAEDLVADHYTVKLVGLQNDDNEEDLYGNIHFAFAGHVLDKVKFTKGEVFDAKTAWDALGGDENLTGDVLPLLNAVAANEYANTQTKNEVLAADVTAFTTAAAEGVDGSTDPSSIDTTTPAYLTLTTNNLKADAAAYDSDPSDDTNELGYFEGGISLNTETTVFANYEYTPGTDVTLGGLHVSVENGSILVLDESLVNDATPANRPDNVLQAYNNKKKAKLRVKLYRNQDLEDSNAQVLHHGTWAAKKWNTMVLPFNVTVEELSKQLGYAIVNVVNPEKTTGTNIVFRLEMDEIPANTPFTVKTSKAIANGATLKFDNKTIKYVAEPSIEAGGQGYTFKAKYAGLTIDKESDGLLKFLYGDQDGWGRVLADKDYSWDIMPFAAYIDLTEATDPNAAREVTFTMEEIDGSTTTIRNISVDTASELKNATEGWYTIDGIRLQGAPTEKGIYINNGKKVVLK